MVLGRLLGRLLNDRCAEVDVPISDSDDDARSVMSSVVSGSEYSTSSRRISLSKRVVTSTVDLSNRVAEFQDKIRAKFPRTSLTDLRIRKMSAGASPSRPVHRQHSEAGRHLIKSGYLIEMAPDGKRKRRHLLLFNDFIACSRFTKMPGLTGRQMVLKWYYHLSQVSLKTEPASLEPNMSGAANAASLLSQAAELRNRIARSPSYQLRKKLVAIEDKLLMEAADLPLTLTVKMQSSHNSSELKTDNYTFLFASELKRTTWMSTIQMLQSKIDPKLTAVLQRSVIDYYIKSCRVEPITRWTNTSDDIFFTKGELTVNVHSLMGLKKPADVFVVVEWDTYGHYLHKRRTRSLDIVEPLRQQQLILKLNGARSLRVLLYEQNDQQSAIYRGGAELKITEQWLRSLNSYFTYVPLTQHCFSSDVAYDAGELHLQLSFNFTAESTPEESAVNSQPQRGNVFNVAIEDICRRDGVEIPSIISRCVEEVERRGIEEVGIYRVSGSIADLNRLRRKFDVKPSSCALHDVDIHCITGLLKSFLRQLPVSLFTEKLYQDFINAFYSLGTGVVDAAEADLTVDDRGRTLVTLFSRLPRVNQTILTYLFEHLLHISNKEAQNKMSLKNLATVFGPTIVRSATLNSAGADLKNFVSTGMLDVAAQSGIILFFLTRLKRRLPFRLPDQKLHFYQC